jgi:carboxymethylenebutenolidase
MPNIDIATETLTIDVPGSTTPMDGYLARPLDSGPHPAVIVGMELFGVNAHIRDVTERFAREGYVAMAPNLFHRTLPGESLPFGDEGRKLGFAHLRQLGRADAITSVAAVLDFLAVRPDTQSKPVFVGFSLGAHIGYLAATQLPLGACVCFYAHWLLHPDIPLGGPEPTITLTPGIAAHGVRMLIVAGEQDEYVTADHIEALDRALTEAGVIHEIARYPEARHGFFCDMRDSFDAKARDLAWQRVLAFLRQPRNPVAAE